MTGWAGRRSRGPDKRPGLAWFEPLSPGKITVCILEIMPFFADNAFVHELLPDHRRRGRPGFEEQSLKPQEAAVGPGGLVVAAELGEKHPEIAGMVCSTIQALLEGSGGDSGYIGPQKTNT